MLTRLIAFSLRNRLFVLATGAHAVTTTQALEDVDVVILSIPLDRIPGIAPLFTSLSGGTVVIDTSNYYPLRDGRIDREDARYVIQDNIAKIEEKRELRRQVMENGSKLEGPFFTSDPRAGSPLSFHYTVTNTNSGHNLPSGSLGAQPEVWLNVALIDPDGETVWESGYVDQHGDMADLHSLDVRAGILPHDDQLLDHDEHTERGDGACERAQQRPRSVAVVSA